MTIGYKVTNTSLQSLNRSPVVGKPRVQYSLTNIAKRVK